MFGECSEIRCYRGDVTSSKALGARIAHWRKRRGLNSQQLARKAAVGHSYLRSVEAGLDSPSTYWVAKVADALDIDAEILYEGDREDTERVDYLPVIRRTLAAVDLMDETLEPRPLDKLVAEVRQLGTWRRGARYRKISETMPDLVENLLIAGEEHGETVYGLLTDAYRAANSMAHKFGFSDLSMTAIERMLWAADKSGDPLRLASVKYQKAATLARIGAQAQAMRLLDRTVADVDALNHNDPGVLAVLSTLHMRAGTIAGTIGQEDISRAHLAEAERLARDLEDGALVFDTVVGPTNVQLHRIAAEVDLGNAGHALKISRATHLPNGYARERAAYYWVDTARACLAAGDPDAAAEALMESKEAAAEHFAASRTVKAAVRTTLDESTRVTPVLRTLSLAAGLTD